MKSGHAHVNYNPTSNKQQFSLISLKQSKLKIGRASTFHHTRVVNQTLVNRLLVINR